MLELIVGAFRSFLRLDHWLSGGHLLDALHDERRQREHNRSWARGFLKDKRLEHQQQVLQREARVSKSLNQPQLGRPGSRRTP